MLQMLKAIITFGRRLTVLGMCVVMALVSTIVIAIALFLSIAKRP